jgi:alpha-N-acetylglucosamine transferase
MQSETAICFVLATPPSERAVETLKRRTRRLLGRLSFVENSIAPRWSPVRRMGYGAGLRACVQSLRRRHRKLPPVIVLRPAGEGLPLADVDELIPINPAPYDSISATGTYWGREIYYKLEVFNLRQYKRIVYLDCDTIVLDDISALWDSRRYSAQSFYAVRETEDMGVHPSVVGKLNTGVMVINPDLLPEDAFERMLALARRGESYDRGDQGIVDSYLRREKGASAGELEPAYNIMTAIKKIGRWDLYKNEIKILHFTNRLKPWMPEHHLDATFDPDFKRLWSEAYGIAPVPFQDETTP